MKFVNKCLKEEWFSLIELLDNHKDGGVNIKELLNNNNINNKEEDASPKELMNKDEDFISPTSYIELP